MLLDDHFQNGLDALKKSAMAAGATEDECASAIMVQGMTSGRFLDGYAQQVARMRAEGYVVALYGQNDEVV